VITVKIGDLFSSNARTLVNTVNCVGVMGKGIALEFKKHFPEMFKDYVRRCENGEVKLGNPYLYKRTCPPWILNFPTKDHWRSVAKLSDIIAGLDHLAGHYREWGITSLAVPPLGCGNGQLEWRVVGPTLYRRLKQLDIPVELYAPFGTPHEELKTSFLDQATDEESPAPYKVEPGWIALVEILRMIESEPYRWPVGRTTFQKIAYFATQSEIPTGLSYARGSYGPYAEEVKPKIATLMNNGLINEERLGRMLAIRVGHTYNDARRAYAPHLEQWKPIIDKIVDLFLRMNTHQAEVSATVHFAAQEIRLEKNAKPSEDEIFKSVMQWKQRRRPPLDEKEVALTIRNLNMLSWLDAEVSDNLPISEEEILNV